MLMNRFLPLYLCLLAAGSLLYSCEPTQPETPLNAEARHDAANALEGLQVAEGLELTLFAAEPLLVNPTNIDIDARGRVWVCEGYNYRMHLNPGNPQKEAGDRIIILEDTTGDGKADLQKVFYQGNDVNAALGIAVLGPKVIVSCSPNVWVFTDEDGDDVPERKELLFSGIGGEQHDHGMHAFVFGPDGKLYFNYGNEGKQLLDKDGQPLTDKFGREVKAGGKPYRQGMVFRCNPDGSGLEVLAHNFRNNYEVAVDAFGTLWQSDNDDDGNKGVRINYVMEYGNYGYRDELTGAGWRAKRTGMHPEIPKRHWHLNDPGVVPNLLQTGAGSPTGLIVYEGSLLPERFHNQLIHCDAGPNVVRAYPVEKAGAGYTAGIVNLLKGTQDDWFRPSDVCVAPDGSIFVADWYDPGVGGHKVGDLQRGRIYRLAPPATPYQVPACDVSDIAGAVQALKNPNLAVRYLAWNALQQAGEAAEAALQQLTADPNPRLQARALWLLARLEGKAPQYIQQALQSEIPGLRIQALRMARQLDAAQLPAYIEQVLKDADPQVRREAAISLHELDPALIAPLWTQLALQYDGQDRWYLEALGIGAARNWQACFDHWLAAVGEQWHSPAGKDIVWRSRAEAALPLLAQLITDEHSPAEDMDRYFRAFDFHTAPLKDQLLASMLQGQHPQQAHIRATALRHISPAYIRTSSQLKQVLNQTLAEVQGTEAYLDLVEKLELKDQQQGLLDILYAHPNEQLGLDAARLLLKLEGESLLKKQIYSGSDRQKKALFTALGNIRSWEAANFLEPLVMDEGLDLPTRSLAVQAMANGWNGENRVLELLQTHQLPDALVVPAATALLDTWRGDIRAGAAAFLDLPQAGEVSLPPVNELVKRQGEPAKGKKVFDTYCASCHQVNGAGTRFGPDLSEIGSKLSPEALYAAILQPDAGISFGYEGVLITLKDGSKVSGYIESQTEEALSLRMMGGLSQTYARSDIVSVEFLPRSLMTPNLHATMGEQGLIDLVAYLRSLQRKQEEVASSR